ncbi:sulfotransferase [Nocardioides sp. GY 10113]|uniref:sulfotransferase family protein n=1 Tax=Nocardioides sp. GY 10113 TaxID=2569761 RepID=UPI0010A8C005|nr:sulfotransferase [Nocardioides sp. GY 10113]TIC88386.1 sulfotransferase [Nocardioides sp. GY 10113]
MSDLPSILIAGAGRAGTTALASAMAHHPDLRLSTPKEPHYLALHGQSASFSGPGDAATINREAITHESGYRALFSDLGAEELGVDASVSTLYHFERSIPEIRRLLDDPRIIVILREPVARARSAYDYMRSRGFETSASLTDAVAQEDHRVAAGWHHLWHYTRMSRYADALAAFAREFGRDRMLVLFHDDLEVRYEVTIARALNFAGVSDLPRDVLVNTRVNSSGVPRNWAVAAVLRGVVGTPRFRSLAKSVTTLETRERLRRLALRRPDASANQPEDEALSRLFVDDLAALREFLVDDAEVPRWLA